jgi:peptidoglycan/LPS O-acetylase OafA/YrhL
MLTNPVILRLHSMPPTDSVPQQVEALAPSPMSAKRVSELGGILGLAILLVLICHFGCATNFAPNHLWLCCLLDVGSLSWNSIDLFRALSGFLIDGFPPAAQNSPNHFKAFYARGFFRIIPICAVVVGISRIPIAPRFFGGATP